jgi:hypothetical protein
VTLLNQVTPRGPLIVRRAVDDVAGRASGDFDENELLSHIRAGVSRRREYV